MGGKDEGAVRVLTPGASRTTNNQGTLVYDAVPAGALKVRPVRHLRGVHRTQGGQRGERDGLRDELDVPVGEQEVPAPGMEAVRLVVVPPVHRRRTASG